MFDIFTDRTRTIAIIAALLAFLTVGASACTGQTVTRANGTVPRLKFAVITDGQTPDPFWSEVKQGIDRAAADMAITATYQAADPFDIALMSHLIDVAIATKPDGLVVSIPDCSGLTPAIKRAQLVGIPVISINSGNDCSSLGLLEYVGQAGYQIGLESGQKLIAAGAKHVLCVNQQVGNPDLDARCRGINDALTQAHIKSEVLAVDLNNQTAAQQIQMKLIQDTSIDTVITLNPTIASSTMDALAQSGHLSRIKLATFDISSEVLQAILQGNMLFAVDQKPYVQGYLSIELLNRYRKHLNNIAASVSTTTNPSFVTIENVLQVKATPTPSIP